MSWSVEFVGHPDRVIDALKDHGTKLVGQAQIEYLDSVPHLIGLVSQSFVKEGVPGYSKPFLKLKAHGSGVVGRKELENGELGEMEQIARSVQVSIEPMYGVLE
jgi:hypothetical protein